MTRRLPTVVLMAEASINGWPLVVQLLEEAETEDDVDEIVDRLWVLQELSGD